MLKTEQIKTVLISTEATPTGHERIVVAFRDGDELYVPLDSGRPANKDLIDHETLYIRHSDSADSYRVYDVKDHRSISTADRQRLEAYVHRPISVTTEVLHLTGTDRSIVRTNAEPPGFVAVIDGSERALGALAPALKIADWFGKPLQVCAVTGGADDLDTAAAVDFQLAGTGLSDADVTFIAKPDLEAALFDLMRRGQIIVTAAFGIWALDGRLHGFLSGLVQHNAPAVIGIGPNVSPDWEPSKDQPIIVCVDASEHAHEFVDRIDPLLLPPRGPLQVVHVTTENPPDESVARDVANELHARYGMPVSAKHVTGTHAAEAIGTVASTLNAQLVVLNSWHRPSPNEPSIASTSVTSVAHSPCPVMILCAAEPQPDAQDS